jgi:hypothetical protein
MRKTPAKMLSAVDRHANSIMYYDTHPHGQSVQRGLNIMMQAILSEYGCYFGFTYLDKDGLNMKPEDVAAQKWKENPERIAFIVRR